MSKRNKIILLSIAFIFAILACDVNIVQSPAQPNLELTVTAQALVLQQGGQAPVAVNPPVANNANPSAASNANPAATNTANPSAANNANNSPAAGPVTVTVSVETNCRSGPGLIYNSVYSMSVSDVAEVIGKNTLTNYWIIKIPNGGGSTCWLWGQYATVNGNTAGLPEFATLTPKATATATATKKPTAVPATATTIAAPILNPPSAPSNIKTITTCTDLGNGKYSYDGTVLWSDNSNDEAGFRINMFDTAIIVAEVGTNVHGYNYSIPSSQSAITLSVEAFNNAGSSQPVATSIHCP